MSDTSTPSRGQDIRGIAAGALPWLVAAALITPAFLPATMNPGSLSMAALGLGMVLSVVAALNGRSVDRRASVALALIAALALWLIATSSLSRNPLVSIWGTIGQHNGSMLLVLSLTWLTVSALLVGRRELKVLLGVIASAGALATVAAAVEVMRSGGERAWGSAAGVFENSASLGQFLAVAAIAAIAWALSDRRPIVRGAAFICLALCAAGMWIGESRAAVLGVACALVSAWLLTVASTQGRGLRVWAAGLPLAALGVAGLAVAAARGVLGSAGVALVQSLGNQRDVIWNSAVEQFAQAPLTGAGLEQFSVWISWSLDANGRLAYNAAYDPHSFVMALLTGGGVIALILWIAAAVALLSALGGAYSRSNRSPAVAVAACTVVALCGSALVMWFSPAAVLAASAVTGAVLGAGLSASDADDTARLPVMTRAALPWACAVLCAGIVVACAPGLNAEMRYARSTTPSAQELSALYVAWRDPAFAAQSVAAQLASPAGAIAPLDFSAFTNDQQRWHVSLALNSLFYDQAVSRGSGTDTWAAFEQTLARGREADPATTLWDALGALEAKRLGRDEEAAAYARRALEGRIGDSERAALTPIAEGR